MEDPANDREPGAPPDEVARRWIVRLASGEMEGEELGRLHAWLAANPTHRRAFERERAFWHEMAGLEAAFAAAPAEPADRAGLRPRSRRWRPAAAVGGLLAACLAIFVVLGDPATALRADHATGVGGQRSVTLPDGSTAHLNTDTAIAVEFGPTERRIALLAGEALFDVRRDPARPFRVLAAGGATRAVGTAFVIRADDDEASVTVTEGRVAVSSPAGSATPIPASAGERTGYRRGGAPSSPVQIDSATATSWRQGRVVIDGLPLDRALAELDRYRPGRIVLLGNGGRPVSGVFDIARIDDAVAALAATHGLGVTQLTPYLTILR